MFSPDSRLSQGQCGCVCGSSSVHTSVSSPRPASHKAAAIQDCAPTATQPTPGTVTWHKVVGTVHTGPALWAWQHLAPSPGIVRTGPTLWAWQQLAQGGRHSTHRPHMLGLATAGTRWQAQCTPAPHTGPGNSWHHHLA